MKSGHWQYGALFVSGLVAAVPLTTQAADAPSTGADTLEEVLVTAQRRAEPVLDVPLSITVIGSGEIEQLHATNLRDLEAVAPGLVIQPAGSPGQTQIVLRGLPSFTSASVVATLIDDAPVGSSTASADGQFSLDMLPYDIERIEILRGPQGTLYGANSMGGVLKYVTKDPSLTAYEAQIGGEAFDIKGGGSLGSGARGTLSAPLIDSALAVRGSLYYEQTPGYIKNPWRGVDHENTLAQYGGRLALLWQPASDLQIKLQGIYQRIDSAGDAIIFAQVLGTAQDSYYRPGNWVYGDLTYPHLLAEPFYSDLTFISGTLDWHTAFGNFVAVSSYSDKALSQTQDVTGIYLDPSIPVRLRYETGSKKFSQEFRLASSSDRRLEWLAGAYYTGERSWTDVYADAYNQQLNPHPAVSPVTEGQSPSTYTEYAVFGSLTYRISQKLDLTGGLRCLTNSQEVNSYTPPSDQYPEGAPPVHLRIAETPWTYTFSARFSPRPEAMAYVRVASGYRPGAPNAPIPGYPEIPPLATSDTMVDYEIGVKSELLNRTATLDLDVFKVNWNNMQITIPTADGRFNYTTNGGEITSRGFELTATGRPGPALQLQVNGAYTDVYATEAVPSAGIVPGTRLPASPRWTAAAMLDYQLRDFDHWTPRLSAAFRYVSSEYTVLSTTPPVGLVPAYSSVNLDLRMSKGCYQVALYAKNVFDTRTFANGGVGAGPNNTGFVFGGFTIEPRVVGLSATMTL